MKPLWYVLYEAGAEVVVEREPDPSRGIREFVVGTGGKSLYSFGDVKPNSEARGSESYGVIRFGLKAGGYDWEFVPTEEGAFGDSGSGVCH